MRKLRSQSSAIQEGFSLVSAIFIVVILGLIGGYIVSLTALTNASSSLSGLGVKAYYAAKSGLEWGVYQVAPLGGAAPYNCPASPTTITFTQGGLSGLSAIVSCSSSSFTEYGTTYKVFQINSTGQYGVSGSGDFVSRQLYTTVIQPGM
jgi:MSHA biogenesis protein MshP